MGRPRKNPEEKQEKRQITLGDLARIDEQGYRWSDFERELETRVEREGRVSYQQCGGGRRVWKKRVGGD